MAKLILNTEEVEEDFFSDCRLMAIGSALPGYTLCWWMNNVCDFNFIRQPDMDICVQEGKTSAKKGGSLFDTVTDIAEELFYFPVYKHDLPYYEASVYLYTNNFSNKKLIPELKFADYLMLIPFASYIEPEEDIYKELANIQDIGWTRDIDLELLKNKKNLIV
jgi:hypothetical protein